MRAATLISWLVTASLGAFMLRTWLARGGLRSERAKAGGLPPPLIFGHAAAALTGLLAWAAVALLMVAVGLGLCTVTLWTPYPARKPGERREPAARDARKPSDYQEFEVTDEMIARLLTEPAPASRNHEIRPNPAVLVPIAHGFAAIATFTLAVLSAIM